MDQCAWREQRTFVVLDRRGDGKDVMDLTAGFSDASMRYKGLHSPDTAVGWRWGVVAAPATGYALSRSL